MGGCRSSYNNSGVSAKHNLKKALEKQSPAEIELYLKQLKSTILGTMDDEIFMIANLTLNAMSYSLYTGNITSFMFLYNKLNC